MILLTFLKLQFSCLESIAFYKKYKKNNLFWLNLPKKYLWENIRFFDKSHVLTPLKKISIFSTFLKLYFSGLKSILFYPEYQITIFCGLICPNNTWFFDKNRKLTPLEHFCFLDFFKTSLFWFKNHSFLYKI